MSSADTPADPDVLLVHGTAIAVGQYAVLIRGPSGSGKSDLALRCLAMGRSSIVPEPALLVADDQVRVRLTATGLEATAPETIRGKLEVRGLGIVTVPTLAAANLILLADLVSESEVERMPDPSRREALAGIELPVVLLAAATPSAPAKLLMALGSEVGRLSLAGHPVEENPCVRREPL